MWEEVQGVHRVDKDLEIRISVHGWQSNHAPSTFRDNNDTPDLSAFEKLRITIDPPPKDDPGRIILMRKNVIDFVRVLNNAEIIPPTTIDLTNTTHNQWHTIRASDNQLFSSRTDGLFGPQWGNQVNVAWILICFLPLRKSASCHVLLPERSPAFANQMSESAQTVERYSLQEDEEDFRNICLRARVAFGPAWESHFSQPTTDCPIAALNDVSDLALDKALDWWEGETAKRLRRERRTHWVVYVDWFKARANFVRKSLTERSWYRANSYLLNQMPDRERHGREIDESEECDEENDDENGSLEDLPDWMSGFGLGENDVGNWPKKQVRAPRKTQPES